MSFDSSENHRSGPGVLGGQTHSTYASAMGGLQNAPVAIFGLAFALYLFEADRMSSFLTVETAGINSIVITFSSACAMVALLFVYSRCSGFRMTRHTGVCLGVAALDSLASLAATVTFSSSEYLGAALAMLTRFLCPILLLWWGEALLMLRARQGAMLVAFACVVLGGLNLFSGLLRPQLTQYIISSFPVLSVLCLFWFKGGAFGFTGGPCPSGCGEPPLDRSLMEAYSLSVRVSTASGLLLPLLALPVPFGYVHNAWIPTQDGGVVSMLIQMSAAMGTALGGLLLVSLVMFFWGRRRIYLYMSLPIILITLAFALASSIGVPVPYFYIVLLNIAQKVTFFFVLTAPFLLSTDNAPMSSLCLSVALYQCGKAISSYMAYTLSPDAFSAAVVAVILALIAGFFVGLVVNQGKAVYKEALPGDRDATPPTVRHAGAGMGAGVGTDCCGRTPNGAAEGDAKGPSADGGPGQAPSAPVDVLVRRYGLSLREREVLVLLLEGRTAGDVAQELVISNATAKTHMRNLYKKVGVHSQPELMALAKQEGLEGRSGR